MTEPKVWEDMTPEEKGALLLAWYEGKEIEWFNPRPERTFNDWKPYNSNPVHIYNEFAYRVKPEPKVERVRLHFCFHFCVDYNTNVFAGPQQRYTDTHRITFNLVDGEPDCNSIQMEVL